MAVLTLSSPLKQLFVGHPRKFKLVNEGLKLETVADLLWHLPRRYVDVDALSDEVALAEGAQITVQAEVIDRQVSSFRNRHTNKQQYRVVATIRTATQRFSTTSFVPHSNMAENLEAQLQPGATGTFSGKLKIFNGSWQLTSPTIVMEGDDSLAEVLVGPRPVYPLVQGLDSWDLSKVLVQVFELIGEVPEVLPADLQRRFDVLDIVTALRWVHLPADWAQITAARHRLRFEEALILQLVMAKRRALHRRLGTTGWPVREDGVLAAFDAALPFELTAGQHEVGAEIAAELAGIHPMNRLLQGEVSSGKTLVALRAMLQVVDAGGQAVLLAPTEVLAQQHFLSITSLLGDLARDSGLLGMGADGPGVNVALLTGSMTRAQRADSMSRMITGEAGLVIGTHALLEPDVEFADLGLVVVDEQHRFGVEQRAALTDKAGTPPHVLVMTATPIPRTVAMTVFGDLETSVLTELPAGRAPIQTSVVPVAHKPEWLDRVWQRVREEVAQGHQAFVVCPRITGDEPEAGESDHLDYDEDGQVLAKTVKTIAAVDEVARDLAAGALAGLRLGVLHGKLAPADKERVMAQFAAGELDVLVATTVIEVGIDVPNATVMVLLDADRFGVSQLHQLRGRVGRGGLPGLCLLVTQVETAGPAQVRLDAVAATTDGFELSRVDLAQRREGDVLGRWQSGAQSSLVTLQVLRDEKTIAAAREAAEALLAEDPELSRWPVLEEAVRQVEISAEADFMDKS